MSQQSRKNTIMNWVITIPYVVTFFSILVVFHPIVLVASWISSDAHKWALDRMNLCIILNIRFIAGTMFRVIGAPYLPKDKAIIFVSNHQSMYDIPMLMWLCRTRRVGFIAKKELGKWIPSISLSLRKLCSVLIDRKDANQALSAIRAFGEAKERALGVAAVFPEGTRARDGVMKRFKMSGLKVLLEAMPSAVIQPVAIRGNWELLRYNFFPVPFGTSVSIEFLEPIVRSEGESVGERLVEIERVIRDGVGEG